MYKTVDVAISAFGAHVQCLHKCITTSMIPCSDGHIHASMDGHTHAFKWLTMLACTAADHLPRCWCGGGGSAGVCVCLHCLDAEPAQAAFSLHRLSLRSSSPFCPSCSPLRTPLHPLLPPSLPTGRGAERHVHITSPAIHPQRAQGPCWCTLWASPRASGGSHLSRVTNDVDGAAWNARQVTELLRASGQDEGFAL